MPYLTAERSIHVHRVSNTQITTFVHDLTDNSIHVNGTAVKQDTLPMQDENQRRTKGCA